MTLTLHRPYLGLPSLSRRIVPAVGGGLPTTDLVAHWAFRDLATLFQDAARTTAASLDGDPVGGVTDLSGSGNHLSQATASKRPSLQLAEQNGLATCSFDGTDDDLLSALNLPGGNGGYTIHAVFGPDRLGGGDGILSWGNTSDNQLVSLRQSSGGYVNDWWANDLVVSATYDTDHYYLVTARYIQSGLRAIWQNGGTALGSNTPTGKNTMAAPAKVGISDAGGRMRGFIGELLVYSAGQSDADRDAAWMFLAGTWELSLG